MFRTRSLLRTLQPLGDRILVRRAAKESTTSSGIILATSPKDPNEGTVVAVGPGERDVSGMLHPVNIAVGETVLLPEYGGTKIKIADDEMFLFRETDILGKFE